MNDNKSVEDIADALLPIIIKKLQKFKNKESKEKSKLGSMGGKATVKKYGKKYMSELGKKGVLKRKEKQDKK